MERIQIITLICSLLFLLYITYLISKRKLREEYSVLWIVCTVILIVFSFWRKGFDVIAELLGIYSPPNLIFTGAIFAVLIYLLHLSIVVSKLQSQNKALTQELALLKQSLSEKNK